MPDYCLNILVSTIGIPGYSFRTFCSYPDYPKAINLRFYAILADFQPFLQHFMTQYDLKNKLAGMVLRCSSLNILYPLKAIGVSLGPENKPFYWIRHFRSWFGAQICFFRLFGGANRQKRIIFKILFGFCLITLISWNKNDTHRNLKIWPKNHAIPPTPTWSQVNWKKMLFIWQFQLFVFRRVMFS